jgi:ribosome-associated toxin RatA of RatAB toxin-antitoxin module
MTTFKKKIKIDSSIEDIWKVVSNLGDIYKFNPGVSKSYYSTEQTEGVGAARICELYPIGKILETATDWEDGKSFLLKIDTIEKAPPVKNFTGKFELNAIGRNQTEVSLTLNYDMKLGFIGQLLNKLILKSKMESGIEDLLKGLKVHLEQGVFVGDLNSLKEILTAA